MTPAVTVELEAERVADGDDQLAAPERLGIADRGARQVARGTCTQQREIRVGILAQRTRVHQAALGVGEPHLLGAVDDVAVGQNEAVRRNHHAGTDAAGAAFGAKGFHAHHRGADFVGHGDHGIGIGVEDVGVGRGRGPRPADVRDIGRRSKIEHRRLKGMC